MNDTLTGSIATVPPGRWLVGVSGGADSVALLRLLQPRPDLSLMVAHLNHQQRGDESDEDQRFVQSLCTSLSIRCHTAKLDEIALSSRDSPANASARFRHARVRFFTELVESHSLNGVILAHHFDDHVETVFLRLLRGAGYAGLCGMSADTHVENLRILRPLLRVRAADLRRYLQSINQPWRDDSSNSSPEYQRNVVRRALAGQDRLVQSIDGLASACRALREWVDKHSYEPGESLPLGMLRTTRIIAEAVARKWLVARGLRHDLIEPAVIDRLIGMATDLANPASQTFPSEVQVHRRRGVLVTGIAASRHVARQLSAATLPPGSSA